MQLHVLNALVEALGLAAAGALNATTLQEMLLGAVLPWRKQKLFGQFGIFMTLLGVKGVLEMIMSHRAPSSLLI